MALAPPAKCLRGKISLPGAVASALGLGSLSQEVDIAAWLATSPMGHDLLVALNLNGVWTDIAKPNGTPGVIDGPKYDITMWSEIMAYIRTNGAKAWIMKEIMAFITNLLAAFFKGLGMGGGGTPTTMPPSGDFDWRIAVNDSLGTDFVLEDHNGDGIPEMHGK